MSDTTPATPPPGLPTVFTTSWCPFCARLTRQLQERDVPFTEVDVEQDPSAASFVESVNDGNRVVPTVLYSDGSTATNPGASKVRHKIAELVDAAG